MPDDNRTVINDFALGKRQRRVEPMGQRCLLARRLVERGVRFVQIYSHGWDSHDRLEQHHRRRAQETDKPIAALLTDLKQRGLLDETLVVWGGEFGRTPDKFHGLFLFRIQSRRRHPGCDDA